MRRLSALASRLLYRVVEIIMVVFFALLLGLVFIVSFDKTSTGLVVFAAWSIISALAFYNPLPY